MERPHQPQPPRSPIWAKHSGNPEWCHQKLAYLKDLLRFYEDLKRQWDATIADLTEHCAWEKIPGEHPYASLEAMLQGELGHDRTTLA